MSSLNTDEHIITMKNGMKIPFCIRSDGMVNATNIYKSTGKHLNAFQNIQAGRKAIADVKAKTGLKKDQLIIIKKPTNGTWIHKDLSRYYCKWISVELEKLVIKLLDDLETKDIEKDIEKENDSGDNKIIKHMASTLIQPRLLEYKLTLSDKSEMIIPVRSDGMINATVLCKAANKLFANYKQLESTEAYLQALSRDIGQPITKLLTIIQGGNPKLQGTWVHRKVAYHLAQWCDPNFAVQVSNWLDELLLTGQLQAGNEKSTKELDNYYKDQLSVEKIKYNEIEVKYERMLKPVIANKYSEKDIRENIEEMRVNLSRSLPSIFIGCHVYSAVIDIQIKDDVLEVLYKIGFTTDVNERFKQHRNSYPMFVPIAIIPVSSIKIEKEVHASIPSDLRVKYNNEREIYQYDDLPSKFIEYIQDIVHAKDVQNKDDIIRDLKYANEIQTRDMKILEKDMTIMKLQHQLEMLSIQKV